MSDLTGEPNNENAGRSRRRFRLPPGLLGLVAVGIICCAALAQPAPPPPATAPAADAMAAAPAAAPATEEQTLYQLFKGGGFFMWPLLACSVLALAIIIERLLALRRGNVIPPGFMPGLRGVFRDPADDRDAALEYCRRNDSAVSRMVAAGVKRMPRGAAATEKAIEDAGANETLKLRRNMRMLYAIGSIATLLGLIGTISGMIKAFQVASGGGLGKSELLAKGIYEAMVCTFGGLAVAIVVTAFYYFLMGRIERLISDMNDEFEEFTDRYIIAGRAAAGAADDEMVPLGAGR